MAKEKITYDTVVDYEKIDPAKISGQRAARTTTHNLERFGFVELPASRGESSYVWDEGYWYRAGVMEGLGTKNLVADALDLKNPDASSNYRAIAQDSIAMIVNDLIVSGADPQLFWVHLAAGRSEWFSDERRIEAFNLGCAAVCNELGITWAGGESPVLPDIIEPHASEISGFVLGRIHPKHRYVPGDGLEASDAITLIGSSGIHSNGVSATRKLEERSPGIYDTVLPDRTTFGETILRPTNLYVKLVQSLLENRTKLKRLESITGHGWRKIMRAKEPYTYRMHELPPAMPIFDFLKNQLGVNDAEMFSNYNMGAGFAVFSPESEVDDIIAASAEQGFPAWDAGRVEDGPRRVIIEPKKLIFEAQSLELR